jgi:DNA-binding NarL/FixJ family response regulator
MNISELKVLIIEDELLFAKHLEVKLKDKVANVFVANNSENGTYYLTEEKPHLIFLDNLLPGIDGIDVIKFYKEKSPDVKIVLMSSVFSVDDISTALKNGADYVFNKKKELDESIDLILSSFTPEEKNEYGIFQYFNWFSSDSKNKKVERIGIIEDEELFTLDLKSTLNKITQTDKPINISSYSNKSSFINDSNNKNLDLIFLDYYLPDSDGKEMIEIIKKQSPSAQIIVLSGQTDPNIAVDLNMLGINYYIVKNNEWKSNLLDCLFKNGIIEM